MARTSKSAAVAGDPNRNDKPLRYGALSDLVGYHLRRAQARVFDDFMASVAGEGRGAEAGGITPGQFGVLALIDANPGLSQSALARALGIERSTMVEVIDRLEGQSLVARTVSLADRRSYALHLTEAGHALLARLKPVIKRHERHMTADLSDEEVATLIDLLRRIGAPSG